MNSAIVWLFVVAAPDLPSPGEGRGWAPATLPTDFLGLVETGATSASFLAANLTSITFLAPPFGFGTLPPTTLAFPVTSFLTAASPFSSLRMLPIGRIAVFPSLNDHALKVGPAENDTIPADISAFFETSGNDSPLSPLLTADWTES